MRPYKKWRRWHCLSGWPWRGYLALTGWESTFSTQASRWAQGKGRLHRQVSSGSKLHYQLKPNQTMRLDARQRQLFSSSHTPSKLHCQLKRSQSMSIATREMSLRFKHPTAYPWYVTFTSDTQFIFANDLLYKTIDCTGLIFSELCLSNDRQYRDQQHTRLTSHVHFIQVSGTSCTNIKSWWRHRMEIFSALLAICAGNSPVTGEFPTQRPVTRSFDVYFDLRPNKQLSKQSWGWWFETPSRQLWRHCNATKPLPRFENGKTTAST